MPGNATLAPWFVATYDRTLHRTPQRGSILKDVVFEENGVRAKEHFFPAHGRSLAHVRPAFAPIQGSRTVKKLPKVVLKPIEDYAHIDEYEMARITTSATMSYAANARDAVERACDQWILDAWASPNSDAIGTAHPKNGTASAITLELLGKGMGALLTRGIGPRDMLTFVYPEDHFESIIAINQLISRDYSERGMIATGRPPPIFGMRWRGIEARAEGGGAITDAGDVDLSNRGGLKNSVGYIVAKKGTGLALGMVNNMRDMSWRNDINAWQIGAKLLGNATMIDRSMRVEFELSTAGLGLS